MIRPTAPALAAALATLAGAAGAQPANPPPPAPGYAVSSDGRVVLSGFGTCVRSGFWTPANAAEPCDRMARAELPAVPVARAEPPQEPAPAPQPQALAEPPRPVIQKLTLSTDVLFDFGKADLKDAGKQRLDQLAEEIKDANVDEIVAVGHADRIASEQYNQKLSEERAQAVRSYLEQRGARAQQLTAQGAGESAPVTGDSCRKMGPERASNKKLVDCLQPDRRVEIEVLGSREVAAESSPAAAGSGGAPRR